MAEKRVYSLEKPAESEATAAFTTLVLVGSNKGKGPGEILLADPEKKSDLIGTRDYIRDKLDKRPGNIKQIDAIEEAINMLDAGTLIEMVGAGGSAASGLVRYNEVNKYMSDINDQGHRLFYAINIRCDYAKNYPWTLEITNTIAPYDKDENRRLVPRMKEKSFQSKSSISMSDREWVRVIKKINRSIQLFEQAYYPAMYKQALEIARCHTAKYQSEREKSSGDSVSGKNNIAA